VTQQLLLNIEWSSCAAQNCAISVPEGVPANASKTLLNGKVLAAVGQEC
jgi:hypothetical protein